MSRDYLSLAFVVFFFSSLTTECQFLPCASMLSDTQEGEIISDAVDTSMICMFLQRFDLDLSLRNDEGKTVLDLAAGKPAVRALLEDYVKRQQNRLNPVSRLPVQSKSSLSDRGTFFIALCALDAFVAEVMVGRVQRT